MRTCLAALLFGLLWATPAHAVGLGTTGWFADDLGGGGAGGGRWFGGQWLPSFDVYPSDQLSLQFHALDTVALLIDGTDIIFLGGDLNYTMWTGAAWGELEGVIEPGGSLDLYLDDGDVALVVGVTSRFGFRGGDAMKVGLYVVPGVGVAAGDAGDGVVWGGALQLSMWFPGAA